MEEIKPVYCSSIKHFAILVYYVIIIITIIIINDNESLESYLWLNLTIQSCLFYRISLTSLFRRPKSAVIQVWLAIRTCIHSLHG